MEFVFKVSGGLMLFSAVCVVLAILADMQYGDGKFAKLFYVGIGFFAVSVFLVIIGRGRGGD